MTTAHYLSKELHYGKGTRAYWSKQPAGKAIVFIHGFLGNALTTWTNFQTQLLSDPKCAGCDLIYYGYDGFKVQVGNSAAAFRVFMEELLTRPAELANSTLLPLVHRPPDFAYTRVVVVGHSLGAIVSRRALLDAHQQQRGWLPRVRLAFFAPAHLGANVVELGTEALTNVHWLGAVIGFAGRWQGTVLNDLKVDSTTLSKLADDMRQANASGNAPYLAAAKVWFGEFENVVTVGAFPGDPVLDPPIPGRRHVNVCKPDGGYTLPVREVVKLL
jgi:pimeloyl-ACP methyl ester carboxylesterase